jgi:hypothetical protein
MDNLNHKMSIQPDYVLVERPEGFKVVPFEQPQMLMEISAFCKAAARQKVLVVGPRTNVNLTRFDILDLGKEIADLNLRIAVAESHDASDEDVEFLETTAVNRGGSIRFFDNQKDAEDWLTIM